jgi:hypothetical protein
MNIDPNTASLEEIQAAILAGESLTREQYRTIIDRYRGDRKSASERSTASRSKKAAAAELASFDLMAEINQAMGGK